MIMSDRFTYLALTGPCIAVVWWAADALRSYRPRLRQGAVGVAVALLLSWSVVTWRQVGYWRDGATLSQQTEAVAAEISAKAAAATGFAATSGWRPLTRDEALETGILLGFVVIAFGWPEWGRASFSRLERILAYLARRPVWLMAVTALMPLAIRLLWLPIYPIPEPRIHDEFGHLLIGDTFASGRLANPPDPMREHFETVYVLQEPSYASYYPVGQGVLLGLAQLARVNPWFAIWASVGLMCGALYWMLAGWASAALGFGGGR